MSELVEETAADRRALTAFYRRMDAGDAAIQAYQSTATQTVAPQTMASYPRYIDDYLTKLCAAPGQRQPQQPADGNFAAIQCRTALNAKERLSQFSKWCGTGDCNHATLFHETTERVRALMPAKPGSSQSRNPDDHRRSSPPLSRDR